MKRFLPLCALTVFLVIFAASTAPAEVKIPSIIGSNMLLQRDLPCTIWGWADAGEEIVVTIAGQQKTAKAGENGKWSLKLDPLQAGGPHTMTITGKNELVLENILVGEVWVCSGQSNMQWSVNVSNNAGHEIQNANFPEIRLITVPCVSKLEPQNDFSGKWVECTPQTVPGFTAVGYFFGRKLHQDLKVPVGLINCSWGGSSCETWINPDVVAKNSDYAAIMDRRAKKDEALKAEGKDSGDNQQAGYLYNGMIRPILNYGIRGAIWYQGESNAGRAYQYRSLFPCMIENWRDEWKQGDFPFYWVQLANFMDINRDPGESNWAELREAQSMTNSLKNSGEAVIIDIGDAKDIHPRNKQDVGFRLAVQALNETYGRSDVKHESPRYKAMKVDGNKIALTFDYAYDGLYSKGALPAGFAVAGEDKKFSWASAEIVAPDTVVVSSAQVPKPVAVRYAWANNPVVTMFNSVNLPMAPFRTDDWPGVTVNNK